MRRLVSALAVMGFLATTGDIGSGQSGTTPSIEGVWRGISATTTGANASSNPKRQPMLLIYTKGYYAVVAQDAAVPLPPRQAPAPPKNPAQLTDAEKIARYDFWQPVIAQAGTYSLKGNIVTQQNMVAKGALTTVVREVRLEDGGKTMVEIQKSAPGQPVSETRRVFARADMPSPSPAIEGVWQGVNYVVTGANAANNRKRLPNIQIYTRGHYAFVAQDGTTQIPPRQAPPAMKISGKPTDAEKIALYNYWLPVGVSAGAYVVKGNLLTQQPIIAKGVPAGATFESRLEDGGKRWIHIVKSAAGEAASETRRTLTRLE